MKLRYYTYNIAYANHNCMYIVVIVLINNIVYSHYQSLPYYNQHSVVI